HQLSPLSLHDALPISASASGCATTSRTFADAGSAERPFPAGSPIGAPRFELGTSCPPDKRANQAAPRPVKPNSSSRLVGGTTPRDRKSTRLNSSHSQI